MRVSEADPRRAVVAHLVAPAAAAAGGASPGRPVARILSGKSFSAQRETIRFLKERGGADRRLFAVDFEDADDRPWFWLLAAERDERGGWSARGVAGGGGGAPRRPAPWLNFCGAWGRGRLYGGGRIHPGGVELSRVRVTLANGAELEDDTEGDVALFVSNQDAAPLTVELFDAAGRLAASHPV